MTEFTKDEILKNLIDNKTPSTKHDGFAGLLTTGMFIAAGSVVSGKINPYTINGGNPIKLIKKRFNNKIITKLLKSKWWELDDKKINLIAKTLCSNDFKKFFKLIKNINE